GKKIKDLGDYDGEERTAKWSPDSTLLAVSFHDTRLSGSTIFRRVSHRHLFSVSYDFSEINFEALHLERYLRYDPELDREAQWGIGSSGIEHTDVIVELRSLSP